MSIQHVEGNYNHLEQNVLVMVSLSIKLGGSLAFFTTYLSIFLPNSNKACIYLFVDRFVNVKTIIQLLNTPLQEKIVICG